jgi:hypothetical protein
MPWWLWLLDAVGVVLLLVVVAGILLVVRRRVLERPGGTFECGLRALGPESGSDAVNGWVLGLGRYRDDSLEWFRIFSPRPSPTIVWRRHELVVLEQRDPLSAERHALYGGHVVVRCRTPTGDLELALSASSLTGLSSWLEAGPPGSQRSA